MKDWLVEIKVTQDGKTIKTYSRVVSHDRDPIGSGFSKLCSPPIKHLIIKSEEIKTTEEV